MNDIRTRAFEGGPLGPWETGHLWVATILFREIVLEGLSKRKDSSSEDYFFGPTRMGNHLPPLFKDNSVNGD